MKVICLNVWGGRLSDKILDFLHSNNDVDVFCLQEVYHDAANKDEFITFDRDKINFKILDDIKKLLKDYNIIFHPYLGDWWGLCIAYKKTLKVYEHGEIFVHSYKGWNIEMEKQGYTAKNLQFIKLRVDKENYNIINFHGLWNNQGKTDTEERLKQSRNVAQFINKLEGKVILCGDFNLSPQTESMSIIENSGLTNLIKTHKIQSTRTSFYTKPNKFADYILISKDVQEIEFKVLPDELSDHSPLYLEFK